MIPRFRLERPKTVDEALAAFARDPDDSAYLAGGTELLQVMKMGLASIGTLIDLKAVAELGGIMVDPGGTLVIGALTTHRQIERSETVRTHTPELAGLARRIANVRVRSTGTLGGNLAFAEPHSDPATFLLVCGATIELTGPSGSRSLPIDAFITGPLTTARERDEIITAIRIPEAPAGSARAYAKIAFFERPAASVAVSATVADGAISAAEVAVGSLTDVPERIHEAGRRLVGVPVADIEERIRPIAAGFAGLIEPFEDLNGSVAYKRQLATTLIAQATIRAVRIAAA